MSVYPDLFRPRFPPEKQLQYKSYSYIPAYVKKSNYNSANRITFGSTRKLVIVQENRLRLGLFRKKSLRGVRCRS